MGSWTRSLAAIAALVLPLALWAAPAWALLDTVYVSPQGAFNGNCQSPATACRSLMAAETQVNEGGRIVMFGDGVITGTRLAKQVTVVGDGKVMVAGLGVSLGAGEKSVFSNFKIVNSFFYIVGAGKVILRDVTIDNTLNDNTSVSFRGNAGARLVMENVSITNGAAGVYVSSIDGGATQAVLNNVKISLSSTSAVYVEGPSTVLLMGSTLVGSTQPDLALVNGAKAISFGDNVIRSGTPTQTVPRN